MTPDEVKQATKKPRVDVDIPNCFQPVHSSFSAPHLSNIPCQDPYLDQAQDPYLDQAQDQAQDQAEGQDCTTAVFSIPKQLSQDQEQYQDGSAALLDAARRGNIKEINKLLNQGVDVNARNQWGVSALAVAVAANKEAAVIALMSRGADVNARVTVSAALLLIERLSNRPCSRYAGLASGVPLLVHAGAPRC
jgi:ankyrin repeat protein